MEWSDGSQTDEAITWDDIPAERYAKAGDFTVNGNVTVAASNAETATERAAGNTVTFPVTAKVTVAPASEGKGETDGNAGQNGQQEGQNDNSSTDTQHSNKPNAKPESKTKGAKALAKTGSAIAQLAVAAVAVTVLGCALFLRRRRNS